MGDGLEELARGVRGAGNSNTRQQALGTYLLALHQADERQRLHIQEDERQREAAAAALSIATAAARRCLEVCQQVEEHNQTFGDLQQAAQKADHAIELQKKVLLGYDRSVVQEQEAVLSAKSAQPGAQLYDQTVSEIHLLNATMTDYLRQRLFASKRKEAQHELVQLTSRLTNFFGLDQESEIHRAELQQAEEGVQQYQNNPHLIQLLLLDKDQQKLKINHGEQVQALRLLQGDGPNICPTCGNTLSEAQQLARRSELETWLQTTYPTAALQVSNRRQNLLTYSEEWETAKAAATVQLKLAHSQSNEDTKRETQRREFQKQLVSAEKKVADAETECADQGVQFPFDDRLEETLRGQIQILEEKAKLLKQAHLAFSQVAEWEVRLTHSMEEQRNGREEVLRLEVVRQGIKYDGTAHGEVFALLESAKQDRENADERVGEGKALLVRSSERAEKSIDEGRLFQQRKDELNQAIFVLQTEGHLLHHLSHFQSHFFDANTREVMQRATGLIRSATAQAIYTLELESDGKLYYRDRTRGRHLASRLSGGEQALVGLCIRLALAEQAQAISTNGRVKFLVLDEVLGSLDDERRQQVQKIFDTVLNAGTFE